MMNHFLTAAHQYKDSYVLGNIHSDNVLTTYSDDHYNLIICTLDN